MTVDPGEAMKHERYEIWVSKSGGESELRLADHPVCCLVPHDFWGQRMRKVKSFLARDWEQAKRKRDAFLVDL